MPGSPAWGQLGAVTVSQQLPHHHPPPPLPPGAASHILRGGGQRGPRGGRATAMPGALGDLGRDQPLPPTAEALDEKMSFWRNKPQPLSLAGTGGVTSVMSWLFSALGTQRGTCLQGAETVAVPWGCSQILWLLPALRRGTARKGVYSPPITLLKTPLVRGRGACPCPRPHPCPSPCPHPCPYPCPHPCPQPGWARAAKFLRTDADVGFSATPLWSGAGCPAGLAEGQAISPSCHHACLSPRWPLAAPGPRRDLGAARAGAGSLQERVPPPPWWRGAPCRAPAASGSCLP